jgi:DNA polymerase elongation subunit (family B)
MTSLPPYKPRRNDLISVPLNEPIEFSAIDWYECDLVTDTPIERKDSYLNQEHNKTYTIFIFGCNSKGQSICLRVKNYMPYFYIQIPDEFNDNQIQDFVNNFNSLSCEDYDEDELAEYEEAQSDKNYTFTEEFKRKSRYYKSSIVEPKSEFNTIKKKSMYKLDIEDKKDLKTHLVEKKIFWSFMNEQKFTFLKLAHKSKMGHRFMERVFKSPLKLNITGKAEKAIKYNLFESDLEPILRFLHDTKIKPSSWIRIDAGKFKIEHKQSKTQINISCDWTDITHLDKAEIPPILIASFDIEADSSHGDFPIPKKDCKKLSSQLAVAWIRDMKNIEKKGYDKVPGFIASKSLLPVNVIYSDKKNDEYDTEMMKQCKELLDLKIGAGTGSAGSAGGAVAVAGAGGGDTKEINYLREVIKYIKSKKNIATKKDFFIHRIKQALGTEQYAKFDDDIDLIYLKKPIKAKVFTNSNDFMMFVDKIYSICNRPIRKVKANNEMKKAVKEVTAIETAKLAKNPRFTIDDLIKIINEVAKKYKILEKDLQDKIITKETMVRFINILLNKSFGHAEGDKVIQIGTVFWRYGEPEICHNNIITLKGCDAFKVGDKNCEVISRMMERDVLLEWSKLIELHDPDIIIGYNTFGFDESFMYDRIADLCIDVERASLTKEDIKTLEQNTNYNKFINMGRLDDNIIKKVPDAKGAMINKKLSSSALGDNFLYYFNMPGRVQIDLLKVCQASLTKLPSYKLDNVAEFYISGKIKEIGNAEDGVNSSESCYLKVDNIQELDIGNYIVISMAATTAKLFDGEKLKILEIDRASKKIKVDRAVPKFCLSSGPVWGLGKDDITPQDIFRMQKGTNTDRAEVAKYCIQDCVLLIRLLRKLEVVPNNFGMSNVCLVPFAYIFLRGQGIKAFSLITNECAKEDFLLPVLEKIEPEEVDVDEGVRRVHTIIAGATGGGDIEDVDSGELGLDGGDGGDGGDGDGELGAGGSDDEEGETEDKGEIEDKGETEGKSKIKFTLKSNFNQIVMNEESYEGAIVLKPKTDIYTDDPIVVLDFSSLYPSEMISSDLSHDRICEDPYWLGDIGAKHLKELGLSYLDRSYDNFEWINPKIKSKGKRKCGNTTVRFVQYPDGKKGLIPRVLQGLLKSRKTTKKLMDAEADPFKKSLYDGLQLAYKVTANSIYGQIGAKTSKIFKPQIAASTTAGGRGRIIHARDYVLKNYAQSEIIYGDTDSVFLKFKLETYEGEKLSDREKLIRAIAIGQDVEQKIKVELPGVHALAYEKTLFPFILISKKRYLALKYEDSPDSCKQISMGLVMRRRDNAAILKHCYIGVIDHIVKNKNVPNAIKFVQDEIKKMIDEKFDMNMFVISKTLASYYKDEDSIAHKVLANRIIDRGDNAPASNERIPYIFIKIKEEKGVDYLNGDRIEHVDYVRKHNLQIDYEKYIESQLVKPISQIFELIVEQLPMFPYGLGYYDEMTNIWYNKYNGDIEKTEKKIRQLKSLMIKKLIFQPLIDYANSKVNKVNTLDNWFKTEEVIEEEVKAEVKEVIKVEKPKHEIKVKKTKQLSLDSFF